MRNSTIALAFIALCFSIPIGSSTADAAVANADGGGVSQMTYGHRAHRRNMLGLHHPHYSHFPYYPRRHYAPFGGHKGYRGIPQHRRYYGMHGYWSPTWRYPRSLYYHHRVH